MGEVGYKHHILTVTIITPFNFNFDQQFPRVSGT